MTSPVEQLMITAGKAAQSQLEQQAAAKKVADSIKTPPPAETPQTGQQAAGSGQ